MAKVTEEHTSADEERSFENFQETVRSLLHVPKAELDAALQKREAEQEKAKQGDQN